MEIIRTEILKLRSGDNYAEISCDGYDASIFVLVHAKDKIKTKLIESYEDYENFMTYGEMEVFSFWKQKVVNMYNVGNDLVEDLFKTNSLSKIQSRILKNRINDGTFKSEYLKINKKVVY